MVMPSLSVKRSIEGVYYNSNSNYIYIVTGVADDDQLYAGDAAISLSTAIANGNTQNSSGQKGDWLEAVATTN